jgi:hypothetical protein
MLITFEMLKQKQTKPKKHEQRPDIFLVITPLFLGEVVFQVAQFLSLNIQLKNRGFQVGSATFENYLDMLNNNSNTFVCQLNIDIFA